MLTKVWLLSAGERLVKSFGQGYLMFYVMVAGIGNGPVDNFPGADAFDLLFTMNNVKAGAVAAVLSLLTSIASTPLGVDKNSPSVTVTETVPTVASNEPTPHG